MRPLICMQIVFDESLCHCMCHFISLPDEHTFTMSQAALHDGHIYDKRSACVYEYAKPKICFLPHWLYMSSAVKIDSAQITPSRLSPTADAYLDEGRISHIWLQAASLLRLYLLHCTLAMT